MGRLASSSSNTPASSGGRGRLWKPAGVDGVGNLGAEQAGREDHADAAAAGEQRPSSTEASVPVAMAPPSAQMSNVAMAISTVTAARRER